jgi:hypothetical protein
VSHGISCADLFRKTLFFQSFQLYRGTVRTAAAAESSVCIGAFAVNCRLLRAMGTALLVLVGVPGAIRTASAQDLEPRAYAASPVGLRFIGLAAGRSTGDVVVDPSLPIEDVEAAVNSIGLAAGTTFDLAGRTALIVAAFPYAHADVTGRVGETAGHVTRSGLADPRIKLSVNLIGGQALRPSEFARAVRRPTIVGASVTVVPPLGQYDRTRLINLGANRWSFKYEGGVSHAIGKWTVEGYAGAWTFTTNEAFYTGDVVRQQDPVLALQTHVSYTVRPRLWFSFDATWYSGGTTTVDGVEKSDLQRNSRIGGTLSLPLAAQQSIKVAASIGATTRVGANFTTIAAAWQLSWLR